MCKELIAACIKTRIDTANQHIELWTDCPLSKVQLLPHQCHCSEKTPPLLSTEPHPSNHVHPHDVSHKQHQALGHVPCQQCWALQCTKSWILALDLWHKLSEMCRKKSKGTTYELAIRPSPHNISVFEAQYLVGVSKWETTCRTF